MATKAQPRGRRGTHDRPYTALNLRLLLAGFGLAMSAVLALLAARSDVPWLAVVLALLAAVAAIDLVVVQRRRRARRREDPGGNYSLFE
ncbi:DUF6343 family protein [Polymorphospora sp. NPDC050346]|uniref:DUF6343 family protein n=1 Tax=Polymorphospora sp. NPDC050346 TaxID=3155780 RepID=UPI003406E950